MTKRVSYSHSSGKAHAGCNRYFWLKKIQGVEEPSNATLEWGSAAHLVMETFVKTGKWLAPGVATEEHNGKEYSLQITPDILARCKMAESIAPPPLSEVAVENWAPRLMMVPHPDPDEKPLVRFVGKIDIYTDGTKWLPSVEQVGRRAHDKHVKGHTGLVVFDWKSKGNFDGKWGIPTDEELARDDQGALYGYSLIVGNDLPHHDILFIHGYIASRDRRRVKMVATTITWERMQEVWAGHVEEAEAMYATAQIEEQEDVPYNEGYCFRYGKDCPMKTLNVCTVHKDEVKVSSLFRATGRMDKEGEGHMGSFFEEFKKKASTPVENKSALQPADVAPHEDEHISGAFVLEVAKKASASFGETPITLADLDYFMQIEGLSDKWAWNVAVLGELVIDTPDEVAAIPAERLTKQSVQEILELGGESPVDVQAKALSQVALRNFNEAAQQAPRDVLLKARAQCTEAKQAFIDDLLDNGSFTTPFDNVAPTHRAVLRMAWIKEQGGETIVESDEEMDTLLKHFGVYKRKVQSRIDKVRAQYHEVVGQDPEETPEEAPEEVPVEEDVPDATFAAPPKAKPDASAQRIAELEDQLAEAAQVNSYSDEMIKSLQAKLELHRQADAKLLAAYTGLEAKLALASAEALRLVSIKASAPTGGLTIYVDCAPLGENPVDLDQLPVVAQALEEAEAYVSAGGAPQSEPVPHWTLYKHFGDNAGNRVTGYAKAALVDGVPLGTGEYVMWSRISWLKNADGLLACLQAAGARIVMRP